MRTPRIIRPHKITIFNRLADEVDGESVYKDTKIDNVSVVTKTKSGFSQKEGNTNLKVEDTVIITIDLSDAPTYTHFNAWDKEPVGFTSHTEGDYVIFNDLRLNIIGFVEIIPFGAPEFVELTCQRA